MPNSGTAATVIVGWLRSAAAAVLLLAGAACTSDPVEHSDRIARAAGASRQVMTGVGYQHVVYTRHLSAVAQTLHVYIGGDGHAFVNRYRVAADPTPVNPLALELMLADDAPAAYVGRPCYHGPPDDACRPELWTADRYSEAVVASLTAVLRALMDDHPEARTTVFGYSGGGVLALLAAARVPGVNAVVTVAAPLDVAAWTRAHGYTPLYGSLDPARIGQWPRHLRQLHLYGSRDRNVPPELLAGFEASLSAGGWPAQFRVVEGFDHVCCWRRDWRGILDELR